MGSANKFIGPSIWLFLDQSLIAGINWLYWLVISKLSTTSALGEATTITSLVILIGTITQLGLEYPLLKRASTLRSQAFGTTLAIEIVLTLASVPIIIYAINNFFDKSLHEFIWLAITMLISQPINFVSRFTLLSISDAKSILIIDAIGTSIKFLSGYALVINGFATFGILLSFLFQSLLISGISLALVRKRMVSFSLGNRKYFKEVFKDGLANLPSKLSRMLIISISVVLLASFGLSSSEVGIFYVALMISIFAGAMATSIAYMVIPASAASRRDLTTDSIRISLSLIAPLVAALIVAPDYVMSIMGPGYTSGYLVLLVLSIGVLPSSIVINTISKFNNLDKSRNLIFIGSIEILTFFVTFSILVPLYGSLGAAISTLIAFVASAIPSIIWSERALIRYISTSAIAIITGVAAGYLIGTIVPASPALLSVLISIAITSFAVIGLKNTTTREIKQLVRAAISGK